MKQLSRLRSSAAAALTSIVMVAVANIAYAQTGAATRSGAAAQAGSAQANSVAGQPTGWNENAPDRGSWLSRIFGSSASGAAAPASGATAPASGAAGSGQTDSSGWSSSGHEPDGCRRSSTGEEDFLCKLGRIFWGPDTPRGPNRDMDDNITAGGAGG